MTVFIVIAILVLLIVVHEFGHFLAAKISRVRVEEFGVGYPPRAFTFGRIGETEYTLNWIPFGGFVRLYGDEGEGQHGRGSLVDSPRWKQAVILVAGVAMNAIAALALFAFAFHLGVPQPVQQPIEGQPVRLIIADVLAGSPADAGGIRAGDEIVKMSDRKGNEPKDLTPESITKFVSDRGGLPIEVAYLHESQPKSATIIPANAVIPSAAGRAGIGVKLVLVANVSLPWGEAIYSAFMQTVNGFEMVAGNLWSLVRSIPAGGANLANVVGPVGIVSFVGDAAQNGLGAVLALAAMISINLAIINLIPIPALDGGRLLILAIESAMRRNAPRLAVQVLNALGVALIVVLMVTVTYNDIVHLVS